MHFLAHRYTQEKYMSRSFYQRSKKQQQYEINMLVRKCFGRTYSKHPCAVKKELDLAAIISEPVTIV